MATLLSPGLPGPVLALNKGAGTTLPAGMFGSAAPTVSNFGIMSGELLSSGSELDSISLTAGTWCVVGVVLPDSGTPSPYLNLNSGVYSDSWPTITTVKIAQNVYYISAIVKLTATTTVYLNATSSSNGGGGFLIATQIG